MTEVSYLFHRQVEPVDDITCLGARNDRWLHSPLLLKLASTRSELLPQHDNIIRDECP